MSNKEEYTMNKAISIIIGALIIIVGILVIVNGMFF